MTQRGLGKTINFATIYGVSAFGLSSRTDMGPKEAQEFLDQYFSTYPKVRQYIDDTIHRAGEEGYRGDAAWGEDGISGNSKSRRLALQPEAGVGAAGDQRAHPGDGCGHHKDRHEASPPNACGVRRCKQKCYCRSTTNWCWKCLMGELNTVGLLVRDVMESAYRLDVPLQVDIEAGPNWYEMEELQLPQAQL